MDLSVLVAQSSHVAQASAWTGMVIPLFAIGIGAPVALIFLCRFVRMIEVTSKNYYQAQLKLKMIDKGYSASEIERVVQLKPGEMGSDWEPIVPAKPMRA